MLKDSFNRSHDYLRISLSDQCNFRCLYCMPDEQMEFKPAAHLMSADEVVHLAEIFIAQGIRKIRLTGGEPLVRKDAKEIIERLAQYPIELSLTSNGVFIDKFINSLVTAGVHSINISLDTLDPIKFKSITQRDVFDKVWSNVKLLLQHKIHVKVNCVVMKGINDNEIAAFVGLTKDLPLHIRFIEFMPFTGNDWNKNKVFTHSEILAEIEKEFFFIKLQDAKHDTAKKYQVQGHKGTFAVITTMSEPFCSDCNRLRLTADGKLKNCLFSAEESDLLNQLRAGKDILPLIQQSVLNKKMSQGGQFSDTFSDTDPLKLINRSMIDIGG